MPSGERPGAPPAEPPPALAAGLPALTAVLEAAPGVLLPQGLQLRQVPAPRRLAPWSVAVAAQVERDGQELASGRFVLLHDPDGQPGWDGETRVVAFVDAAVEPEMAADPALAQVGWSWLLEALQQRGAEFRAAGGTVTRTVSSRFGELADDPDEPADDVNQVEVRASWTVVAGPAEVRLDAHLLAWCDLLASTAGLPPPGVTSLPRR